MLRVTPRERSGFLSGAAGISVVGASFAASDALVGFPFASSQAARYLLAALVLAAMARFRLMRLARRELLLMCGVALFGQVIFNAAVIGAVKHGPPSTLGVIVGTAPLIMAVVAPLLQGQRPQQALLGAALLVAAGAGITEGFGGGNALSVSLAVVALVCEVLFSVLAAPVLARIGALQVSAWATLLGGLMCVALIPFDSTPRLPGGVQLAALVYLSLIVTVGAFVGWYRAVAALTVERAGLLVGLMPVSAYLAALVLGIEQAHLAPTVGAALVGLGIVAGMRSGQSRETALISTRTNSASRSGG